ncbi:MAG: amidohydrolase family protein [Gemmatimonadota bacterium]
MRRRRFFRTVGAAGAGLWLGPAMAAGDGVARPPGVAPFGKKSGPFDLVLRGGTVFDGTGAAGRKMDVGAVGDRIVAVGPGLARGTREIDVTGLAVAPGFIDIHSHADLSLFVNPRAESRIRQGVTTEVVGQDGGSVGPWSDEAWETVRDRYRSRFGVEITFRDPVGFLDGIDRLKPAVNVASMVGNGALRGLVIGQENRPAGEEELERMKSLLVRLLEGGCVGLSSGLEYTPSGFASTDELAALAEVAAARMCPYASHMRNEDDALLGAVEEALMVGRLSGVPVEVSHLKCQGRRNYWKTDAVLGLLREARRAGVDVMYDVYPYTAYQTGLSNLFPTELRAGGTAAFLARLAEPGTAAAMERAARAKVALLGDWNRIQISSAREAWARGRRLGDLAAERGLDPYDLAVWLLRSNDGSVGMIGHGMGEESVERLLADPLGMVCSDGGAYAPYGPLSESVPHPRGYGTFPRLLGRYVREKGVLDLPTAIHKITGMPAGRLGFADRGRIAEGAAADLVAFDPATVEDRATFSNPHQYPVGIPVVVVNGVVTLVDGEHTGELGGQSVRREG